MVLGIGCLTAAAYLFQNDKEKRMTALNTKLDKELNELLRAIHEYRINHGEDADEGLITEVLSYVRHARELIGGAK